LPKVGLVTDSTCDLGPAWLAEHGVRMVPLRVLFGEDSFRDWVDFTPSEFYARLDASPFLSKTSQPSPADFEVVYRSLADEGCDSIVVMTLSAGLSGTFESATLAAVKPPVPVRVVDSLSASQGLGIVVKAAVAARDEGAAAAEIEQAAIRASSQVRVYFVLVTMDFLVKGGRAGKATAIAASLLNIKPVLHIDSEGIIEPYRKVKGMRAAIETMAARLAEDSAETPMRCTIMAGEREDLVRMMKDALERSGARYELEGVGLVGAVIGTYTGPQVVGVAYGPAT
jgi:DegV family protein with EDD domain